jgi:4-hydroxy-tetrahydrodipicolinate synthase
VAVPFMPRGEIDYPSFERLVDRLLRQPVGAVTLFGLASEFHKLNDGEVAELQEAFLARTSRSGAAGVISVTDHSADVAVYRAREAESAGADALNLLPPHFLSPSPAAVLEHLERVLEAVEIPVIVQYAPAQTGTHIDPEDLVSLAGRNDNLCCIKVEAAPAGPWVTRLIKESQGRLKPLVGMAGVQMPDALERGAVGVQPGCSFVPIYAEIYRRFLQGDLDGMRALHTELLPYISTWMQSVEYIIQVEKTILYRRGIIATDYCRPPGYSLDERESALIDRFLEQFHEYLT